MACLSAILGAALALVLVVLRPSRRLDVSSRSGESSRASRPTLERAGQLVTIDATLRSFGLWPRRRAGDCPGGGGCDGSRADAWLARPTPFQAR